MDIKLGSGQIIFNNNPLFHCDVAEVNIEAQEEYENNKKIATLYKEPIEIIFECDVNRNGLLSLIHGRKITNNWLKMHGGIMSRTINRKSQGTITLNREIYREGVI